MRQTAVQHGSTTAGAQTRDARIAEPERAPEAEPPGFEKSWALVIGINEYGRGIPPLTTAAGDARRVAEVLLTEHGYDVLLLVDEQASRSLVDKLEQRDDDETPIQIVHRGATVPAEPYDRAADARGAQLILEGPAVKDTLKRVLGQTLPPSVGPNDRLLVYFAGHGITVEKEEGQDGPLGYLVPQDASQDPESLFPLHVFHNLLAELPCRHALLILDCCFAGAIRWSSTRAWRIPPQEISQERYELYTRSKAWQAIASAAYDQTALDTFGQRGSAGDQRHSPFALTLLDALSGKADSYPPAEDERLAGDGLITANEIFQYAQDRVAHIARAQNKHPQTPVLVYLRNHHAGEYVFDNPARPLDLKPAPELTFENNPWRGLESYEKEDNPRFFGRDRAIVELAQHVAQRTLTIVLGASGTGKSSLVKAGLLPCLDGSCRLDLPAEEGENADWEILPVMRPGAAPLQALHTLLATSLPGFAPSTRLDAPDALSKAFAAWSESHPGQSLMLVIDQFEELVTLCQSDDERERFLALLERAVRDRPEYLRIVLTLRSDFEPQFVESALEEHWTDSARYVVPPLSQDELRQVIEGPASGQVLYFEPYALVDELINEVVQTPGALPLLSFTLSELYIRYVKSRRGDRALREADYDALGGVVGALRFRAEEEYLALSTRHRHTLQHIMLRMIAVTGDGVTRRRVTPRELEYGNPAENARVKQIVDRLVEARLLVADTDRDGKQYWEPAHDALVSSWGRLHRWRLDATEYLPLQRRVAQASGDWETESDPRRKTGLLWHDDSRLPAVASLLPADIVDAPPTRGSTGARARGGVTQAARRFSARVTQVVDRIHVADAPPDRERWLNALETDFVWQSVLRRWRNTRALWGSVSAAFGIVLALALLANGLRITANDEANARATQVVVRITAQADAVEQANIAETRQAEAEISSRRALANQFASNAQNVMLGQSDETGNLALLLSLNAVTTTLHTDGYFTANADVVLRDAIHRAHPQELVSLSHPADLGAMVWSADGTRLATAASATIYVWDAEHGTEIARLKASDERIIALAWSPDGTHVAAGSDDKTVEWAAGTPRLYIWHIDERRVVRQIPAHEKAITDVAWHPTDANRVASSSEDQTIRLWNVEFGQQLAELVGHESTVNTIAWSPDGLYIASGSGGEFANDETLVGPDNADALASQSDTSVRIWKVETGEHLLLEGHQERVNDVAWRPDSRALASASGNLWNDIVESVGSTDFAIRLWDTISGQEIRQISGHTASVHAVAWSPDSRRLLSGAGNRQFFGDRAAIQDLTARVWNAETGEELLRFSGHGDPVLAVTWSPDGTRVATAAGNPGPKDPLLERENRVAVWKPLQSEPMVLQAEPGTNWVWTEMHSLGWEESGTHLKGLMETREMSLIRYTWDTENGVLLKEDWEQIAGDGEVYFGVVSPDGLRRAYAGGTDIQIVDHINNVVLDTLEGHTEPVRGVAWSPDGKRLVSVSGSFPQYDANGALLAAKDATIRIWDVQKGEQLKRWEGEATYTAVGWFADALAVGDMRGAIQVLDADTGEVVGWLPDHLGGVSALAWSPDGELLATAGQDRRVRMWRIGDETPLRIWEHPAQVTKLVWSPDGTRIATYADDDAVRIWLVDTQDVLALAQSRITRSPATFTPEEIERFGLPTE